MALISWPSFQTAEGDAVAAGNESVTIGTGGALVAQLVPNIGASPTGTFYVVVFQLDDGTVRTELGGSDDIADHDCGGAYYAWPRAREHGGDAALRECSRGQSGD